jgi:hypothetical protein
MAVLSLRDRIGGVDPEHLRRWLEAEVERRSSRSSLWTRAEYEVDRPGRAGRNSGPDRPAIRTRDRQARVLVRGVADLVRKSCGSQCGFMRDDTDHCGR